MIDKKKPGRFCVYLNENDKRHMEAAEILNSKGRKKAQFITDATLFYHYIETGAYKEKYITAYLKEMEEPKKAEDPNQVSAEAADAIMGSLNMFKKKG